MSVGTGRTDRDIAFTLEVKSPKIFENIFLQNGSLVLLGAKGRVNITSGGNRFDERTHLGSNPNVDHRDKYAQINKTRSNTWKTAQYGQATCDGLGIINFVDEDQNSGAQKIGAVGIADTIIEELMNTFPNKVGDAIMATTSGANDPLSIKEQLPATAFGSQTQSTGGITRSDYPGTGDRTQAWQTQYSNTSADLSSAAGIATVTAFIWQHCSEGSAMNMQPDLCLTTAGVMAQASGAADVLRRYGVNDTLLKYSFDNLKIANAAFIADRNVADSAAYFLNTNFMRVQVLGGRNMKPSKSVKVIGDGAVGVPLKISQPVEEADALDKTIKAWMTYNLTLGALKYHGFMDNLTQATITA